MPRVRGTVGTVARWMEAMSKGHLRVVDDVGLVHYAETSFMNELATLRFQGLGVRSWCNFDENRGILVRMGTKRQPVTCIRCLGLRRERGGPGSVL